MQQNRNQFDLSIVLALCFLLAFVLPLKDWWSRIGMPWYLPYLLWAALILVIPAASFGRRK